MAVIVYIQAYIQRSTPLVVYSKKLEKHGNIGFEFKMNDIATTIAENFGIFNKFAGNNILDSHPIDPKIPA